MPIAGGDERERVPLRSIPAQRDGVRLPPKIRGERRVPASRRTRPTSAAGVRVAKRNRPRRTRKDATSSAAGRRPRRSRCSSQARPEAAGHDAAAADVAHTMRSTAMRRPCVTTMLPGSTATAALARCSTAPRSTRMWPRRERTAAACVGSSVGWSVTSANRGVSARIVEASRCCIASRSSTPPAPPPTTAIARTPPVSASVCHTVQVRRKASNGLAGSVSSAAPGTRTSGVEPMSSESISKVSVRPVASVAVRVRRSTATTLSRRNAAPASSASGSSSTCVSRGE